MPTDFFSAGKQVVMLRKSVSRISENKKKETHYRMIVSLL